MHETQILACRSVSVLAVPATYRPMSASDRWASSGISGIPCGRTILPLRPSLNVVVSHGAEQGCSTPNVAERGEAWLPVDDERWRAYLDTDDKLVFYCPQCAEREFGT